MFHLFNAREGHGPVTPVQKHRRSIAKLAILAAGLICSGITTYAQVSPVPTGVTVRSRMEESTDWKTCGACGNTGGTGLVATYSMQRGITTPTTDGSATKFSIGGNYAYKNAYWYLPTSNSPSTPLKYLRYEFDLYIPSAYKDAPQAIEFECQQKAAGYVYNFAWQANYSGREWRVFDYVNRRWVSVGLPLTKFTPDKWHHIIAEYHTETGYTVHDALTIDGVRHVVGKKQKAKASTTGHYLTSGFQLDLNKYATDYKVYVDAMKISYK